MTRNLQSNAYSEGEAAGILQFLEASRPLPKKNLQENYRNALILIGKDKETADYWVSYFFK